MEEPMSDDLDLSQLARPSGNDFPETPHDLPYNRPRIDELLMRVRNDERIDLLSEVLGCVDWRSAFTDDQGNPLTLEEISRLYAYYRKKWSDVGTLYLAELLSSEFMTEQRAQGTLAMSPEFLALGRNNPKLWQEIRTFFRRKEFVTAMLAMADESGRSKS
jgi:hypothetical protein